MLEQRILHVVSRYDKHPSGMNEAISAMAAGARAKGCDVAVCSTTLSREKAGGASTGWASVTRLPLLRQWDHACGLEAEILRLCRSGGTVLHAHGLWVYPQLATRRVSRRTGYPFVLSTHGMLEPVRLRISSARKRIIWYAYARRMIASASVILATSEQEQRAILSFGVRRPVRVVPLGVTAPEVSGEKPGKAPDALRTAVFLSRISPVKGLDLLVEAVDQLRPANWIFRLAGPEEGDHGNFLRKMIRAKGLGEWFRWEGPVDNAAKWDILREADIVVLPSRNENFGVVVAEALAMGTPVLTTEQTPWAELVAHDCGWQAPATATGVRESLRRAMALPDSARREMGKRGKQLFNDRYTVERAAEQLLEAIKDACLDRQPI